MANHPEVTFIICTYNRAAYLQDTLDSLLRHEYPSSRFEILVIDNNSTDRTREIVDRYRAETNKNFPVIRYAKEEKQGLSHARNRGIEKADAPNIVYVDDDVRASEAFIPSWLVFFRKYPDVEAAGGRIHVQFDDPRPEWMSHFLLPLLGHHDLGDSMRTYGKHKYPFGGNMGFRKTLFNRFEKFSDSLGRQGNQLRASEEKELFQRLKQSLDVYYLPDALLYHRVNKQRLTPEYIRRQALGLGQSMALQHQQESFSSALTYGVQEIGKMMITAGLFLPYSLILQGSKARMLVKFRKWIAEGYFSVASEAASSTSFEG